MGKIEMKEGTEFTRYSPRHKHNFDQLRFAVKGRMCIGKNKYLETGQIGYFAEGTPYGPLEKFDVNQLGLVLQFGGASRQGFISTKQAREGRELLRPFGEFRDGIFFRSSGPGRKNQDGFEAIWELVNGRKLEYPKPRYQEPIILTPSNFDWNPTSTAGVERKLLGTFTERGTRLEFFRLDKGASWTDVDEPAIRITFVTSGEGTFNGKPFEQYSALEAKAGEAPVFKATSETEIFRMVLPLLDQAKIAQAA
jgi:hypothetical protein